MLGEHGTSEVFVWSGARIAGVPVRGRLRAARARRRARCRARVERDVRYANITIIEGNNASQYGIGMVSARIAEMVLRDEAAVIPIGGYSNALWRHIVAAHASSAAAASARTIEPRLSAEEQRALRRSAGR